VLTYVYVSDEYEDVKENISHVGYSGVSKTFKIVTC
jgi:hypothetical protein